SPGSPRRTVADGAAGALRRGERERAQAAEAEHVERGRPADAALVEQPDQVVDAGHTLVVEAHDEVVRDEPGAAGGTALLDRGDERAEPVVEAGRERVAARNRERLGGDPDVGAAH